MTLTDVLELLVGSAFFCTIGMYIKRAHGDTPPRWLLLPYLVANISASFYYGLSACRLSGLSGLDLGQLYVTVIPRVTLFSGIWLPNIMIMASIVSALMAKHSINALFFFGTGTTRPRLGQVRRLLLENDPEGAVKACLDVFHSAPTYPDALQDGAFLLTQQGYFKEAAGLYRRTMELFANDPVAWSEAAWQLALIHEERWHQHKEAVAIWRQIIRKTPKTELGRRAGARLQQNPELPPNAPGA